MLLLSVSSESLADPIEQDFEIKMHKNIWKHTFSSCFTEKNTTKYNEHYDCHCYYNYNYYDDNSRLTAPYTIRKKKFLFNYA